MNVTKLHRVPRIAFAILGIVALLAVVLVTPQGRAFAQGALRLFTRAEHTTFPVRPVQAPTREPGGSVPTAVPPAPLISVDEAEALLGWDVAELSSAPEGLHYLGARLYGQAVHIAYETQGKDGHLGIMQSREGFVQSDWDRAPAEAIVPVQIGAVEGEFVRGRFVVYVGETSATWAPDAAVLRLRWERDGVWFEMTKSGYAQEIAYLDQAALIELAERLEIQP